MAKAASTKIRLVSEEGTGFFYVAKKNSRTMTEKLLIYALGRGVGAEDMPAVRRILRDAAANDNRFSSLVLGIARSVPFQMRMKPLPEPSGSQ